MAVDNLALNRMRGVCEGGGWRMEQTGWSEVGERNGKKERVCVNEKNRARERKMGRVSQSFISRIRMTNPCLTMCCKMGEKNVQMHI